MTIAPQVPAAATRLIAQPERLRGRFEENYPLGSRSWFSAGGAAELFYQPADADDLVCCIQSVQSATPILAYGVGSNILVRDGGVAGVVIRLGAAFGRIAIEGETIRVGAGALDRAVAEAAAQAGLGGLEFLSGIPGSIGGALRMNAGAFGRQMSDCAISATLVDRAGIRHVLDHAALRFEYRKSKAPEDWIFIEAVLAGDRRAPESIRAIMADIDRQRQAAQPTKGRTGGSTFKNPTGVKAWQTVESIGGRGLRFGGAQVSELHANFMINSNDSSASMLEALGEELRRRARNRDGIALDWEIVIVGSPDMVGAAA